MSLGGLFINSAAANDDKEVIKKYWEKKQEKFEAIYYTAAICRLLCDRLFPDNVVDRTVVRGMGGKSPCIGDSLVYITGGRNQFGTFNLDPPLGHAVVLQRIDIQETWMGAWKDGVQSWNAIKIFGFLNKANPLPYKRWSAWKYEPDTPKNQMADCKIKWEYNRIPNKPQLIFIDFAYF